MRAALLLAAAALAALSASVLPVPFVQPARDASSSASPTEALPKIAPAPAFTLTSQDGMQVSLASLRGKVAAVTFIFTRCTATCPVLTPMMALVQDRLGGDF